jgi:Lectin C-type domain
MRWAVVVALAGCSFKPTQLANATPDGDSSDSTIAVTTDAPPDTAPGFVPACATNSNYTLRPGDTHLYRHLTNGPQFDDAVETCQTDGAYLARLDDVDEETYVRQSYGEVWIGVSDQETEGTFRNIASNNATVFIAPSTVVTYAHFTNGEPNDANMHEDCVYINGDNGTWNDTPCDDTNHGAVCECDPSYKAPPVPACRDMAGAKTYFSRKYFTYTTAATWTAARDQCASIGAYLMVPSDNTENNLIENSGQLNLNGDAWIGAAQNGTTWTWVDQSPWVYTNFSSTPNTTNACARVKSNSGWDTDPCTTPHPYVCECSP